MKNNMTNDMTKGNPTKLILLFSIPLLIGNIFQQFYSMVDTIIVGRFVGVDALAAVGATSSMVFLVNGFATGLSSGFAVLVSQRFGAKDEKGLRKAVASAITLTVISVVVITIVSLLGAMPLLKLMNTPENIIGDAYLYIKIIYAGVVATVAYNLIASILRALGDSKTPLYFLIVSSVLNVILDLVFIIVFKMGVAGAAWATIIAQAVAGIWCTIFMMKKYKILKFEKDELKLNGHYISRLCYMGIPMGLQYSITAIGSVILQTAVNGLGSLVVAAVTASSKISMFLCCPFDALGSTMATYAGQNVGAKKLSRISEGIKKSLLIGSVYSIIALVVSIFFGETIALLFVNAGETELLLMVKQCLVTSAAFFIPLCIVNVVRFTIQGMGYSTFAIFAGICEMIARALCGFILVPMFGFTAVCFASPIAWIFADAFLLPGYKNVSNKLKKKIEISEIDYKNNKDEKIEESITLID